MHVSLTTQQGLAAHTQPARTTPHTIITTSPHNPPIMASSSSASDWECGACASSNKGGKYCIMCATPHQKHQAVLAGLAADFAAPTAVISAPLAVAKAILSAPMPGAVIGAPMRCFYRCCHRHCVYAANFMLIVVCAPCHCSRCCYLCPQFLSLSLSLPPPQLLPK
jgi:hypothetical protein